MSRNEIRLTPEGARKISRTLRKGAQDLSESPFYSSQLTDGSFGDGLKGRELAREYVLSHHVVTETMNGFRLDLETYANAVERSADGLLDTDGDNAEVLRRLEHITPTHHDDAARERAWGSAPDSPYAANDKVLPGEHS